MRSIREIAQIIKARSQKEGIRALRDWGLVAVVILAVFGAFGLGRLSVLMAPKQPILAQNTASAAMSDTGQGLPAGGAYVGSKTGDVYYFPWCTGATAIPLEKRVWFVTEKEAKKAGYRPAGNCKGLKTD